MNPDEYKQNHASSEYIMQSHLPSAIHSLLGIASDQMAGNVLELFVDELVNPEGERSQQQACQRITKNMSIGGNQFWDTGQLAVASGLPYINQIHLVVRTNAQDTVQ